MRNRHTMKDVAKLAGVSLSTVSFVINNTQGQTITEATRSKIWKAIEELDYKPNHLARGMRSKRANAIGVVTAYNIKHLYFLEIINGILDAANTLEYTVTMCNAASDLSEDSSWIRFFEEKRIDGILFIASAHTGDSRQEQQYIEMFKRHGIPFVVIYGSTADKDTSYVNIDFYQNGYDACRHLHERGYSNLLYIAPMDKDHKTPFLPRTERDRISGYEDALALTGSPQSWIVHLPRDFRKQDPSGILAELDSSRQPGGIVTCWATYGLQILNLARDLGIPVPGQMSVIALDSLPYLEHTSPGLSSMQLPFYEIARKGTELLVQQLNGGRQAAVRLNIPCELVVREST